MITYGFHPNESFSVQLGKRLEKNPPCKTKVIRFTPKAIDSGYLNLSFDDKAKAGYKGIKQLARMLKMRKSEFVIDLHDWPLYAGYNGNEIETDYALLYPEQNQRLGDILNVYAKTSRKYKIDVLPTELLDSLSPNSLGLESYPVRLSKDGRFKIMKFRDAEFFMKELIKFIEKNYARDMG